MIINTKKKFIFIEVPKTGTSAIASMLLALDKDNQRNVLPTKNSDFVQVSTHITYNEIKAKLGSSINAFSVIAFYRDPVDLVISKYYFYKVGRSYESFKSGNATLGLTARVLFARLVPLPLWVVLYPYKMSHPFITDETGTIKTTFLGRFESIQTDVNKIFTSFGYAESDLVLRVENKSPYSKNHIFLPSLISWLVSLKSKKDMKLFDVLNRAH